MPNKTNHKSAPVKTKDKPLSNKHKAFVLEYCSNGYNATKAYRTVYKGCSDKTAEVNGCVLLRNTKIKQAIDGFVAETKDKAGWTIELAQQKLIHAHNTAEALNQPAVMVSSIVSINRMFGLDRDSGTGQQPLQINVSTEPKPALKLADTA